MGHVYKFNTLALNVENYSGTWWWTLDFSELQLPLPRHKRLLQVSLHLIPKELSLRGKLVACTNHKELNLSSSVFFCLRKNWTVAVIFFLGFVVVVIVGGGFLLFFYFRYKFISLPAFLMYSSSFSELPWKGETVVKTTNTGVFKVWSCTICVCFTWELFRNTDSWLWSRSPEPETLGWGPATCVFNKSSRWF